MSTSIPQKSHVASPSIAKKVEKEIVGEAKAEEKKVNHAIKQLEKIEKRDVKAQKSISKAEHTLAKAEKEEQATLNDMHKATRKHDQATSKMHSLGHDLEAVKREEAKIQREFHVKKSEVDAVIMEKDAHERVRLGRLSQMRGDKNADAGHALGPDQRQL